MNNYITAAEACKLLKVSNTTLYRYVRENKIKVKKLSDRKFLYDISSIIDSNKKGKSIIYGRVSNTKQKDDLSKQIEILSMYANANGYIVNEIYSDIASGMNENRKGFNDLLNEVLTGNVDNVFISYKDRLTRFGFNYFENLFNKFGTKIVVINQVEQSDQDELSQDLISIIHHFSMKMCSKRRKELKKLVDSINKDITE